MASKLAAPWTPTGIEAPGGQGQIFQVTDGRTQTLYAYKRLLNVASEARAERFKREINLASELRDAGATYLLPVVDAGIDRKGRPYFVTLWMAGGSLEAAVKDGRYVRTPTAGLDVLISLADALCDLHGREVAHRDLKPDNLLLDGEAVLLADFGLALSLEPEGDRLTATGEAVGSRFYIAPENANGINEARDQRPADMYAFGKIIWAVLTGRRPSAREEFLDSSFSALTPTPQLDDLMGLLRLLVEVTPTARLSDWDAVRDDLATMRQVVIVDDDPSRTKPSRTLDAAIRLFAGSRTVLHVRTAISAQTREQQDVEAVVRRISDVLAPVPDAIDTQGLVSIRLSAGGLQLGEAIRRSGDSWPGTTPLPSELPDERAPALMLTLRAVVAGLDAGMSVSAYYYRAEDGLWLVEVPMVGSGAETQVVTAMSEGSLRCVGPLRLGAVGALTAAVRIAEHVREDFSAGAAKFLRILGEGADLLDPEQWSGATGQAG